MTTADTHRPLALHPELAHECSTELAAAAQQLHAAATVLEAAQIQQAARMLLSAATGLHRLVDELEANRLFAQAAAAAAFAAAGATEAAVTQTGEAIAIGTGAAEGDLDELLADGSSPADQDTTAPEPPDPEAIRRRWPLPTPSTTPPAGPPAAELATAVDRYVAATTRLAADGWAGTAADAANERFATFGTWLAAAAAFPTGDHPAVPAL